MAPENLISIDDLSRIEIERLFAITDHFRRSPGDFRNALAGKVVCTLFFEPSTRTRLSFEAAAHRLGARVLSVADMQNTRVGLGEGLLDTTRMAGYYADIVITRHSDEAVMNRIKDTIDVPLINAGEGHQLHPTQTLIDLYTAQEHFGSIDGIRVGMVGGIRHSRAAKSLIAGLRKFKDVRLHIVDSISDTDEGGTTSRDLYGFVDVEHESVADMIKHVDLLYVVRVQRERFTDEATYRRQLNRCRLYRALLAEAPPDLAVMHCLPRSAELDVDVDGTTQNKYFRQASYGVPVRSAILQRYGSEHYMPEFA